MEAKHTVGPWIPQANPDCIDIEGYKRIVAVVPGVDDESIDIARLIAAAPDLLAACEEAKEALEVAQGEWVSVTAAYAPYETHVLKAAVIKLDEAIAKARGGA